MEHQKKTSEWEKLKKRILGPLNLEIRQGFQNRSVSRIGFAAYLKKILLENIPFLADFEKKELLPCLEKAQHYDKLSYKNRKKLLDEILDILTVDISKEPDKSPVKHEPKKSKDNNCSPSDLESLKGVGKKILQDLLCMGINDTTALLKFFPLRYEDRENFPLQLPQKLEPICIYGTVKKSRLSRKKGKKPAIFQILLQTHLGTILVRWFNMPFLSHTMGNGKKIVCFGKLDSNTKTMIHPDFEYIDNEKDSLHFGRIVPIYSFPGTIKKRKISARILRKLVHQCLQKNLIIEIFPDEFKLVNNLLSRKDAFYHIHFPENLIYLKAAKRRFAFEELFFFLYWIHKIKARQKEDSSLKIEIKKEEFLQTLNKTLPFELTSDQIKVLAEILLDLRKAHPMRRLLQGDVGCGKTIIILAVARLLASAGKKTLFMAPTSLLAQQHFDLLQKGNIFANLGLRAGLLTSGYSQTDKRELVKSWKNGEVDILIGTHALLFQSLTDKDIALIAIDEQHKFGVEQRLKLIQYASNAHIIFLSATPIPRTLALTFYGYLDVSTITTGPGKKRNVKTKWCRSRNINSILKKLQATKKNKQKSFYLCPLVEESDKLDLSNVIQRFEYLKEKLPDFSIAFLHGRLKPKEKECILKDFRNSRLDLLVVTSVIEVGIDIPDATLLVVENAERFGLAQLHQMRGRIGRRGEDALCLLWSFCSTDEAEKRLTTFCSHNDGFLLAEEDLKLRGPGEFLGSNQSGIPRKTLSNLLGDIDFIEWVNKVISRKDLNPDDLPELKKELDGFFKDSGFRSFLSK
ncbi:ATP-dependent DNA helicase RecG [Candidatus Riflebacteria bacterium]